MEVPPALLREEEVRCKPGMEEPVGEKEEREALSSFQKIKG